jgi:hypothetical protein
MPGRRRRRPGTATRMVLLVLRELYEEEIVILCDQQTRRTGPNRDIVTSYQLPAASVLLLQPDAARWTKRCALSNGASRA